MKINRKIGFIILLKAYILVSLHGFVPHIHHDFHEEHHHHQDHAHQHDGYQHLHGEHDDPSDFQFLLEHFAHVIGDEFLRKDPNNFSIKIVGNDSYTHTSSLFSLPYDLSLGQERKTISKRPYRWSYYHSVHLQFSGKRGPPFSV
ncbi:MAG: hypothetical protein N4A45_09045 [Flavobacteriales bacterium]|jgi:hypothetical protein|nr:hypothetical protein [Flavobacteriales bacterium]